MPTALSSRATVSTCASWSSAACRGKKTAHGVPKKGPKSAAISSRHNSPTTSTSCAKSVISSPMQVCRRGHAAWIDQVPGRPRPRCRSLCWSHRSRCRARLASASSLSLIGHTLVVTTGESLVVRDRRAEPGHTASTCPRLECPACIPAPPRRSSSFDCAPLTHREQSQKEHDDGSERTMSRPGKRSDRGMKNT